MDDCSYHNRPTLEAGGAADVVKTMTVEKSIRLANKKAKEGCAKEAKLIYRDILKKFPKNQRAQDGLKSLSQVASIEAQKSQDPPSDLLIPLTDLYKAGQLKLALEQVNALLHQFPRSSFLSNFCGVLCSSLKQYSSAIEAYDRAINIKPDYVEAYNNLGNCLVDQNKLDDAVVAYKKALTIEPSYADALNNIGIVFKEQGNFDVALQYYSKAITASPNYHEPHTNMGNIFKAQGKLKEAIKAYGKALKIEPQNANAHYNMGVAYKELGELAEAIVFYKNALAIQPKHVQAQANIGVAYQGLGKLCEAIAAYNIAIEIDPLNVEAYINMGTTLSEQGKLEEAVEVYNKVLEINPENADALYNLGNVLREQEKLREAVQAYVKAIAINPDYAKAYFNMGLSLHEEGKPEEAIKAYRNAVKIKPDYAEVFTNMGVVFQEQGQLDQAIETYKKALVINPESAETHQNLSFSLLNKGKIKEGLEEYEWRWSNPQRASKNRQFSKPQWDGQQTLEGKRVLLWREQGIGDAINWVSRLQLVSALADHCILECPEKLVPLMERSFPNIEVKPEDRTNDKHRNDFDYHLPLGSLYQHFLPEILADIKPSAFLLPDPDRIQFWKKRLRAVGDGPYVGVSWKSANMSQKRIPNYAPISEWAPIFAIPDVTFINLQYVDFADDLAEIQNEFGVKVHNFKDLDHYNDLDEVAALCAALDVVVSTKITVPLISAGVGTLTKLANWRQSTWNNMLLNPSGPAVDIFEKNTWESWIALFEEIASDIEQLKPDTSSVLEGYCYE